MMENLLLLCSLFVDLHVLSEVLLTEVLYSLLYLFLVRIDARFNLGDNLLDVG
jgi:hypothetical protein